MDQIAVWDMTAENLPETEKQLFWADKLSSVCEYLTMETRIRNVTRLLPLMEAICDRYNKSRIHAQETEKDA